MSWRTPECMARWFSPSRAGRDESPPRGTLKKPEPCVNMHRVFLCLFYEFYPRGSSPAMGGFRMTGASFLVCWKISLTNDKK
jgi:hypothetical protein